MTCWNETNSPTTHKVLSRFQREAKAGPLVALLDTPGYTGFPRLLALIAANRARDHLAGFVRCGT